MACRSLNEAYLFVIDGEVKVAGETLGRRDAIGIYNVREFDIEFSKRSEVIILDVPIAKG